MSADAIVTPLVSAAELHRLRDHLTAARPAFLADLERLVSIDCGSYSKAGVDEVGRFVAAFLRRLGADVDTHGHETLGETVIGTFRGASGDASGGARPGARLLMIGHLDTVFPDGTAAERPFAIRNGIATGPGVSDMKAGLLAGLYAIEAALLTAGTLPLERLTFIANPDEELGSPISRSHIRATARESDASLVMECARANGDIVSARKGFRDLRVTVTGRAAHAGVEPEKGRSAIVEAAHQVAGLHALNGRWPGVSVNVGVIEGGIRPNVVPERCVLQVDIRATTREAFDAVAAAIDDLAAAPLVPDTAVTVEELIGHGPMERLPRSVRLVEHAQALSRGLGFDVRDAATGGAGDANITAEAGLPTLDGLGPIGGNDHAPGEYLEVESIVPRTALLAGLLLAVGRDPVVAGWRADAGLRG